MAKLLKLMTKTGVLKLRKISFLPILLALFLLGCKSVPVQTTQVNPLDLLDTDSSLYIRIPVKSHTKLVSSLLESNINGIVSDDATKMAGYLDVIYAGLSSKDDRKRLQVAVKGSLPSLTAVALKKSGWKKYSVKSNSLSESLLSLTSFQNASNTMQLSLLEQNSIACLAQDISPMLSNYAKYSALNYTYTDQDDIWRTSRLYSWVSEETDNIKFYIVRPQNFLSILLGNTVSSSYFKLVYTCGEISQDQNGKYNLTLELEFKDSRLIKGALAMLEVALGLTDAQFENTTPTHIKVTGINISFTQLLKMLGY